MYERVKTYTSMTISSAGWDSNLTNDVVESPASAGRHVDAVIESARNHSDVPPKVTWSMFGKSMIEKCAIEWEMNGQRMTDVVWVRRCYDYKG